MPLLTTPLGLPLRLTDDWQMIALGEQHYCACEFGVKTVVLSACGKCVRQTELVECGLNSLVRQQYRYDSAAHREQQSANGQTDGGSKPEGVVGKGGARKVPDAVSYRAKVQRQPVCPDKVESCGWREESPPQDFSVSRWYCHFLYPCGRIHLSQPCRAGLP